MNITRTSLDLTELSWIGRNHARGPYLRFSFTWKATTEEDLIPAITMPGFRLIKDHKHDRMKIVVPSKKIPGGGEYHVAQISVDLANWILDEFRKKPAIWNKIGQNYKPERMLELPDDLVPELPENVELIG